MTTHEGQRVPRIVAGVDGSLTSDDVLRWAIRQAELTGASVDAVTAWQHHAAISAGAMGVAPVLGYDSTDYRRLAEEALANSLCRAAGTAPAVQVRPRIAEGDAAQVLLAAAADADLLVIGSRGHGGFVGALLGSVIQHCVHQATCPVVIIRGHDHAAARTARPHPERLCRVMTSQLLSTPRRRTQAPPGAAQSPG